MGENEGAGGGGGSEEMEMEIEIRMLPEPWINRDAQATKCCVKTKQGNVERAERENEKQTENEEE